MRRIVNWLSNDSASRAANRPGLPRIAYRIGRYPDFVEAMRRRIDAAPELAAWTYRGADDPAIALLEGSAILADILSFYQEHYANEAYLRTAAWRESVAAGAGCEVVIFLAVWRCSIICASVMSVSRYSTPSINTLSGATLMHGWVRMSLLVRVVLSIWGRAGAARWASVSRPCAPSGVAAGATGAACGVAPVTWASSGPASGVPIGVAVLLVVLDEAYNEFVTAITQKITVAQLLAHTSGLRPSLASGGPWSGTRAGLALVAAVGMALVARRYVVRDYYQTSAPVPTEERTAAGVTAKTA